MPGKDLFSLDIEFACSPPAACLTFLPLCMQVITCDAKCVNMTLNGCLGAFLKPDPPHSHSVMWRTLFGVLLNEAHFMKVLGSSGLLDKLPSL